VQRSAVSAERSEGDQNSIDIYSYYNTDLILNRRLLTSNGWHASRIIGLKPISKQLSCVYNPSC
jgi:hypothetical protein